MKKKICVLVFMFASLLTIAQEAEDTQRAQPQKQFKNTGISLNMGCSFLKSNQFERSLQDNDIVLDIPKMSGLMSLKINAIDLFKFATLSVEVGMEGTNRKADDYYMSLQTINGVVEFLYPVVNERKIRVFASFGLEYSYAMFKYNLLDSTSTSFQDLLVTKDESINLHHNYSYSALFGAYFNYFFRENSGISIFAKYRVPLDKNNTRWKVANTDRSVTNLDKYISNYFIVGVGYVFAF